MRISGNLNWNSVDIDPPENSLQSVDQAPAGTLIIDMYDTRTGALIWRGTAGDFLTNNTDKDKLKVDEEVSQMFKAMPWNAPPVDYDPWQHFSGSLS